MSFLPPLPTCPSSSSPALPGGHLEMWGRGCQCLDTQVEFSLSKRDQCWLGEGGVGGRVHSIPLLFHAPSLHLLSGPQQPEHPDAPQGPAAGGPSPGGGVGALGPPPAASAPAQHCPEGRQIRMALCPGQGSLCQHPLHQTAQQDTLQGMESAGIRGWAQRQEARGPHLGLGPYLCPSSKFGRPLLCPPWGRWGGLSVRCLKENFLNSQYL